MVRRVINAAGSWRVTLLAFAAVAIWWGLSVLPPARYWFEPTSMIVPDAPLGDDVVMLVRREIHHPFFGQWVVTLRRQVGDHWVVVCVARGSGDYTPLAALPEPLTLGWWTEGQCTIDEPGTYFLTTTWIVKPPQWLPGVRRVAPLVSNNFHILEVP